MYIYVCFSKLKRVTIGTSLRAPVIGVCMYIYMYMYIREDACDWG